MNRALRTIALLCIALTTMVGCRRTWDGSVTDPGQFYMAIEHDGLSRTYELHVPTGYNGDSGVPLVFDLHPLVINGLVMELMTDFQSLSDIHGFILVQPNGIDGSWNGGPGCCPPANENDVDDVGLIRAIRDDLIDRDLNIDTSRVFADGMSNGGYLANRIACEDSDLLAAIAPVVASIGYDDVAECVPSKAMSVVMISGGNDSIVSREETFGRWVELNGCFTSHSETVGVFTCTIYTDCDDQVETTHCIGEGVGHCWPGTGFRIYGCNQDLDASQYIWDFFERSAGD